MLHYGRPGTGLELEPGMIFTIEPMINAGKPGIRELADGWTIVTKDHSLSAQWEHTVAGHRDRLRGADHLGGRRRRPPHLPPPMSALTCARRTPARRSPRRAQALRECLPAAGPNPRALLRAARASSSTAPCSDGLERDRADAADAALVAIGGYGRGELFPLRRRPAGAAAERADRRRARGARALDRHAAGTSAWSSATACAPWTSCIEAAAATSRSRPAARGALPRRQPRLFRELRRSAASERCDPAAFFEAKMLEQQQRHAKHQDTPYTLEPNVKESPGGLRDLQVIRGSRAPRASGARWSDLVAQRPDRARRGAPARAHGARPAGPAHPPALPRRAARGPPGVRPPDRARRAARATATRRRARASEAADAALLPRRQGA